MIKEYEKLLKIKSKYDFIDDNSSYFFKHHFIDYEKLYKKWEKEEPDKVIKGYK